MINLDYIWAFDQNNPICAQYNRSIQASQEGRFENENKRMRFYALHQLVERAVTLRPEAHIAECGTFWGHSAHITASIMERRRTDGRLAIFDSFEGLSDFQTQDFSVYVATAEQQASTRKLFRSDFDRVQALLAPFPFVQLYKGWIPTRFQEVADWKFSHVSIDVDLYQPTRDALEFFYPRLLKGGTIFFDDYGYHNFPGSQLAVDELLPDLQPDLFLQLPWGAAMLLK